MTRAIVTGLTDAIFAAIGIALIALVLLLTIGAWEIGVAQIIEWVLV